MLAPFISEAFSIVLTSMLIFGLLDNPLMSLAHSVKRWAICFKSDDNAAMNECFRNKVDFTQKPCEDFYKYACGKNRDRRIEIHKIEMMVNQQLIEIAKEPVKKNDHRALKMVKEMFQSCIENHSNINDLKNMIEHLGGWSLLDPNWKEKNFLWDNFFSKSIEIGYLPTSLFVIDIQRNPYTKLNIIAIRSKGRSDGLIDRILRTSWNLDSAVNQGDTDKFLLNLFLPKLASKIGVDKRKVINEYTEFSQIRRLMSHLNEEPLQTTHKKLSELKLSYGNIPWKKLLAAVFRPIPINNDDVIQIDCPRCLNSLNQFLNTTSTKSLANYLMGSFVFNTILSADDELLTEWLKFEGIFTKKEFCSNKIFYPFRRVLDYEYIKRNYFDKSIIPTVSKFIEKLKAAMESVIMNTPIMDFKTRVKAIAKVKALIFKIGYDDEIKNGQALQYFDKLNIDIKSKSYLLSLSQVMKFTTNEHLRSLKKPNKLPYFEATAGNAAYQIYFNTIFLSINALTRPLYSKGKRPQYLNYGGLGAIIAHEMQHAFDLWSSQFDILGAVTNWWTPEAKQKYFIALECMKNQYSNFINEETGHKVNGELTLTENFADIAGMEVAYKAYYNLSKDGESLLQDFKNHTPLQMFWITFAAAKCSKSSLQEVLERESSDLHAEDKIRVNGVAMNSEEFARDWKCEKNTPMNSPHKCHVWK